MKFVNRYFVLMILALITLPTVRCIVNAFEWRSANFVPITLTNISSQSDVRTGSSMLILDFNGIDDGSAIIIADNTTAARLQDTDGAASDTLITEYKLTFDGDGTANTGKSGGADMENYASHETFLTGGGWPIERFGADNDVQVTLHVKVNIPEDKAPDAGLYQATQTLTVTWSGL